MNMGLGRYEGFGVAGLAATGFEGVLGGVVGGVAGV